MSQTGQGDASPNSMGERVFVPPAAKSRWTGWVVSAGLMMIVLGIFQAIEGLTALFRHTYYAVDSSGLLVGASYTTWGWAHLLLGPDHRGDPDAVLEPSQGQRSDVRPRPGRGTCCRQRDRRRGRRRGIGQRHHCRGLVVPDSLRRRLPGPGGPHVEEGPGARGAARAAEVDGRHRLVLTWQGPHARAAAGGSQPEEPPSRRRRWCGRCRSGAADDERRSLPVGLRRRREPDDRRPGDLLPGRW